MKFELKGANVWGTDKIAITYHDRFTRQEPRTVFRMFRIDGRSFFDNLGTGDGSFRLDVSTMLGWEAIDGGTGFKTKGEAERFAERWIEAVKEQGTLSPRLERD